MLDFAGVLAMNLPPGLVRTGAGLVVPASVEPPPPDRRVIVVNVQMPDSRMGGYRAVAQMVGRAVNELLGKVVVLAVDVRAAENGGLDVGVEMEL